MIRTQRLTLLEAGVELLRAELQGHDAFELAIAAAVPDAWPPEFNDESTVRYVLEKIEANPGGAEWWMYYVIRNDRGGRPEVVIGTAGYKGPPAEDGTVEVGYSLLEEYQHRGYATEAVLALIDRAFDHPEVLRVVAETLPELLGSLNVLDRCGFVSIADGAEPGVLRFEITRERRADAKEEDRSQTE